MNYVWELCKILPWDNFPRSEVWFSTCLSGPLKDPAAQFKPFAKLG